MTTRIEQLHSAWLAAWAEQDADKVASFYTAEARYFDSRVPDGLVGREALRKRLSGLFRLAPPMRYEPWGVWEIEGGFCGRWLWTIEAGDITQLVRGVGLALLDDDKISHNEIYTHALQADPRAS